MSEHAELLREALRSGVRSSIEVTRFAEYHGITRKDANRAISCLLNSGELKIVRKDGLRAYQLVEKD